MKRLNKLFSSKVRIGIFALLLLLTFTFPLIIKDQYIVRMGTLCMMYAALALSLNLVTGFMGQVSLGHAAFFGVGAYTSAILSERLGWPFLITVLCAMLLAGFFGLLLGVPALKLSGSYLAIVSLGFCEIVRLIELNWISMTRGPMGMTGIARPNIFGIQIKSVSSYYYLCLVLLVLFCFIVSNITSSHVGRAIMSIREDSIAASAMGVNVLYWKVATFAISASLAGVMGAFYAHYMRFIDPSAFNFDQSISILSMVILGGSGSIPGSILGAALLSVIPELLRDFASARMLIYGIVLVIMMIFRPMGLLKRMTVRQLLGVEKKYAESDEPAAKGGEA